ncbi:MAG: iron ABC transporter permease [Chloroflexi bacterium]|nr:iron ABC transporter permease [Chloroflexota bacterium]
MAQPPGLLVRLKGRWREWLVLLALGLPLFVFVLIPLLLLVFNSFREISLGEVGFAFNKFSLVNYVTAYANPKTWKMLWDSFIFAIGSTVVAFFLGGVMAFLVERTDAPWRRLSYGMMFVPLIIPGMLLAMAWVLLLSPNIGLINKMWMSIGFDTPLVNGYSMATMWWVQGSIESPLTFLMLGAALRRMDPALEEAAITCGASRLKVAAQITTRLITPAIAGVALLQFVRGLEALEAPLFIGLNSNIMVFSTNILGSLKGSYPPNYGLGFTYATILIILASLGLFAYLRAMRKQEKYVVVTGKGYRPRIINLGRWKAPAVAFQLFFAVVVVGLPLALFVWISLLPGSYQAPSAELISQISLNNYVKVFDRPDILPMLRNTAILAIVAALGVMLFSLLLSSAIFHMKVKGRHVLDELAFIPYAIPAIAMGVAFMVMFLAVPNPVYGTIWILVIAYIIRFLPYGTRFTHAGLAQMHKELEEAGKVSGARFWTVFTRIIVPIMLPSLIGGGLYVAILSVKIFAIAVILYSPDSMVLAIEIYQLWNEGRMGLLGALAVVMIGVLTLLTILGGSKRLGRIAG